LNPDMFSSRVGGLLSIQSTMAFGEGVDPNLSKACGHPFVAHIGPPIDMSNG
jgi:hypothetical protein